MTRRPAVVCRERGGIREIVLQRPVLAIPVLEALANVLDHAESAPTPTVLCSSHPSIFLAGAHLAEIASLDSDTAEAYARRGRAVIDRLTRTSAPVVAAVHGSCSGGGFDLVLGCDEIVAGPRARFHHPGVVRGLITGWGGTDRVPARIGLTNARRALVLGQPIDADRALDLGLVTPTAADPMAEARSRARELAGLHPQRLEMWRTLRGGRFVDRFLAVVVHPW